MYPGLPKTSKKEEYATIVSCLIIVTKHFIASVFGGPGLASIKNFLIKFHSSKSVRKNYYDTFH